MILILQNTTEILVSQLLLAQANIMAEQPTNQNTKQKYTQVLRLYMNCQIIGISVTLALLLF